jgi:dolichol-phosphate mannosyltransferase
MAASGESGADPPVRPANPFVEPKSPPPVGIVLATLNERENLAILLSEIASVLPELPEIVVVDDGSMDGTREFIRAVANRHPEIRVVLNDCPQTIARAHEQGLRASTASFLIFMDADLQHPPSAIPSMVARLSSGFDVVIGSRYMPGGHTGSRTPIRGLISRSAGFMARLLLGNLRGVSDPNSGFFGVRRGAVVLDHDSPRGYYTLMFLLARMNHPRIAEVPYSFRERGSGESKVLNGLAFPFVYAIQLLTARRLEARALVARRKEQALRLGRRAEKEALLRA